MRPPPNDAEADAADDVEANGSDDDAVANVLIAREQANVGGRDLQVVVNITLRPVGVWTRGRTAIYAARWLWPRDVQPLNHW